MILLICGVGQYGTVAKEIAEAMGCFSEIKFLDDNSEFAIGKLDEITTVEYDAAVVAIGNPAVRRDLLEHIKVPAILIHPKANVMPSAEIGDGSVIEAGAVVCSNVKLGKGTLVMANAVVGHDAKIGDFCQLKYNSTIPERAIVPDNTKIECNSVYDMLSDKI